jgi:hypothetical protein
MQAEEVVEGLKQIFDELVAGDGFGECCGGHKCLLGELGVF